MGERFIVKEPVNEDTSSKLYADIIDDSNPPVRVGLVNIVSLTYTLYLVSTGATINSRTDVDVLNAGGGVVTDITENSVDITRLALQIIPADNVMVGSESSEEHLVLIKWTYDTDKKGSKEIVVTIVNLRNVP